MGGSEGGVGIANRTSPRKAAIEKVQAELREEYDVRNERKRELEFLEEGGNPLDFKLRDVASVSVQSTSVTDQHPDQFVTSEVKGSFAITTSPHGDSVESSGRPEATPCEPNSADNLMLLDPEHEFSKGGQSLLHPGRTNVVPSQQSSQMDLSHKTQEHKASAAFGVPRKAYKRRYRSRLNRDGARTSSTDVNPTRGCHVSSLPFRHDPRDVKGLVSDAENENISLNCNSKPASPLNDTLPKTILTGGQDVEGVYVESAAEAIASKNSLDEELSKNTLSSAAKTSNQMGFGGSEAIQDLGEKNPADEGQPSVTATEVENQSSCQMNGFSKKKVDKMTNDARNLSTSCVIKVLDSESSCTQTSLSIDGNNDLEKCSKLSNVDPNGKPEHQTLQDANPVIGSELAKEKKDTVGIDSCTLVKKESDSACQSQGDTDFSLQPKDELIQNESSLQIQVKDQVIIDRMEGSGPIRSESGRKPADRLGDNPQLQNETSSDIIYQDVIVSNLDLPEAGSLGRVATLAVEARTTTGPDSKLASSIDEDAILKEAQLIEAKRKRIGELSIVTSPVEIRQKSHWEYVLEEMAWLANDFAQERIWKIAAAAQICTRAAIACRLRRQEKSSGMDAKTVARTLAKAIIEFWHCVGEKSKELEQQHQKDEKLSVRAYAVRFLRSNEPNIIHSQAEVPLTPDRTSDSGILDLSWDDSLIEDNLFYSVPPGAAETYRQSIESHVAHCERNGCTAQEEVETSACDAAADFGSQDNAYDEDEGETSTYNMPMAFEDGKSSRHGQKKRKNLIHAYGARSYEMGSDLLPMLSAENNATNQQSALLVKRPGSSLNVSIPTKRVRTASRRIISPFTAGASGCIQVPNKTDGSSCDTNSFQEDQSTLRGGVLVPNSMEVESAGNFEKQLPFDSAEVSTRPKKKKKAKHLSSSYEQRWQVDSSFQNDQFQKDQWKKGLDSHQLGSNGNNGSFGQPLMKKPKLMRQSQDNSFDNIPPGGGSVPSPVASQMSNMSNSNKFIKMLGGRDRGRKAKALKMPHGQPGSGGTWSLFEDQALVVLAHDLGPNWELVSDAINSTLHFKCIFRKAKECKERHNFLMDRSSGDGADSAEDSGSSQPYPSTLPGIPKGSARQLFQRLQGPMEEDTLKSHFEKIIMIGQKQHYRKTQDPKQLQQPHESHRMALSEVCQNNLNGGPVLTPLDLCDASVPVPDILSLGYQGPLSSGLANPNQGGATPLLPASGANSAFQGSSNMMIGNTFSSSHGSLSSSASRDGRYVVPKSGSLSADEQQRMQQYNQMIPGRNIPQSNIPASGAIPGTDRGVRILPGANGMGVMGGVNRNLPMARPGFQGIPSSPNPGNMASPGMSPTSMHPGVGAGPGSSMLRPRETLHMMRDSQRQMMTPDLQMPGNSQGVSHFGGLSSPFPNQTGSSPVSSYPVHHQLPHSVSPQQPQVLSPRHPHFQGPANLASNPQQQAYAIRMAKERQMHHRFLQQQQQFGASSDSSMPNVQSQPQLPMSSPMQNSSQAKSQTSGSPPVSLSPLPSSPSMNSMPQHQQKHQKPTQGVVRNPQAGGSGLTNQTGKQRQRQQNQFPQGRQHPQQRQQLQAQAKVAKGVGRGNPVMHQNTPTDASLLNGVSANSGNQYSEKGEAATHLVQSQGLTQNTGQPMRPYVGLQSTNQSLPQQKMYSGQASSSSKPLQVTAQSPPVAPPVLPAGNQSGPSLKPAPAQQKLVNQNHSAPQRAAQPNRQNSSDLSTKPQGRDSDADRLPASRSADIESITTLPQACSNTPNAAQVVSPPSVHKLNASEPLLDSNALKSSTNLSPMVTMPSNSSESVTQAGQGIGQRQQQQQQQLQHPQSPAQQQQMPLLQAGNVNSYRRTTDPRLE